MIELDNLFYDAYTARQHNNAAIDEVTKLYGYNRETPTRVIDGRGMHWHANNDYLDYGDDLTYSVHGGPYKGPNDTVAYLADNVFIVLDSRSEIK